MLAGLLVLGPGLVTQTLAQRPAAATKTGRSEPEPPSPGATMGAYRALREWLDAWAVPAAAPVGAGGAANGAGTLPACAGAAVVLRYQGKTVGRGGELLSSGSATDRESSIERTIWRAFLQAFGEADRRMPGPRDATRSEALREAGKDVVVSLELAGEPTPIEPKTFAEIDQRVSPGVEGVAVRLGNRIEAAFPSAMLLTNQTPAEAARSLVAKITGSAEVALTEAKDLREKTKIAFLRFRVVHLAQVGAGQEPRFLTRGGRLVEVGQLDTARLRVLAGSMAAYLGSATPVREAPLGLRAGYRPWLGEYEGEAAPAHQQALAALALRRYAHAAWADRVSAAKAADLADRLLHELDDVDLSETAPWERAGSAAMAVLALLEPTAPASVRPLPEPQASHQDLLDRCTKRMRAAWTSGAFEPGLAPGEQAAVAAAWVRLGAAEGGGNVAVRMEPLRWCLRDATAGGGGGIAGLMPLLGWAEIEAIGPDHAPPAAVALRQMRTQLWVGQLRSDAAGADRADLVGGLALGGPGSLPTWDGLRPLAFMATMLRIPALTPREEVGGEVARLLQAARFLRQLQADEHVSWMYANPAQAQGGIRAAVWDQSMPPDATSMGLLMTVELLQSLEAISGKR